MRGSSKWHFVPLQYMFYTTFQPKLSNYNLGKPFFPSKILGNEAKWKWGHFETAKHILKLLPVL